MLRLIFIIILISLGIIYRQHLNPDAISLFIEKYGIIAPYIFILICAIKPILFFLPILGLGIVSGILFGPIWGTIYTVIGGALSTIVGFYFARWMGKNSVEKLVSINKGVKKLDDWAKKYGKNAVLSMRFFNIPWDIVSYWAGLSKISFKDFYIASLIPLIPISFLYVYFGAHCFSPKSAGFIISLTIMFILGAIPFIRQRLSRGRS